ncbi:MAG: DUF3137 domain-containing protein [Bacteroidota bacterium]
MTDSGNFRKFYEDELVPHLTNLEVFRKKIYAGIVLFVLLFFLGVFSSIYYLGGFYEFSFENITNKNFIIALLLLVFWAMIGVLVFKKLFENKLAGVRYKFKRSVIVKIVEFIDPGLEYFEDQLISQDEYEASMIFPVKAKRFRGEDYVLGRDGKISFKFSELHSRYFLKDHRGRKAFITIFHGLFFIADFHKDFNCETIVLPDTAHKLFGPLGDFVQKHNIFRDKVIKVDDPEFDKEFVVYGNNPEVSAKILTPRLLKRITDFKKKSGHKVFISFIGSKVNVAISLTKDLFEPPIFGSMLVYDTIYENYKYLILATGIVKDLDLNSDIWAD